MLEKTIFSLTPGDRLCFKTAHYLAHIKRPAAKSLWLFELPFSAQQHGENQPIYVIFIDCTWKKNIHCCGFRSPLVWDCFMWLKEVLQSQISVLTLNRFGALLPGSQPKLFLSLLFPRGLPWIRPPACCQGSHGTSISVSLSLSLLFLQGSRVVFESKLKISLFTLSWLTWLLLQYPTHCHVPLLLFVQCQTMYCEL